MKIGMFITIIVSYVVFFILYSKKPKEVVKTVIEVKEVIKYVTKEDNLQVDRVVRSFSGKNPRVVTVERIRNQSSLVSKSEEKKNISASEHTKDLTKYSISYILPVSTSLIDYSKSQMMFGLRLGGLPLFVNIGTNLKFDMLAGISMEF